MKLYTNIEFLERVDPKKHYVSPGGYEVKTKDGNVIWFDFFQYSGEIDRDNPKIVHCCQSELDTETARDADDLDAVLKNGEIERIEDWYVYTGEPDDELLHPVRLQSASFELEDGTSVSLPGAILEQVNSIFKEAQG
ncbi:MAG: hypothetical protein Q4B26_06130 [Eubacteriales bacterium]|nr:hypothetical protein [Eubacteriales bacterium]